ncbi:hypothetical protein [Parasphingorhabdus sp.]|uniref:hypothetical protein n=1 Tax=Parasphingorhabdus sp. TaxID=2709688 RepID=UPI003C7099DD
MFSRASKTTIAVITSIGMIGSSTPVLAQARVVASSGGAAASYPEGKTLREDAILLLGRGDRVTILVNNVRRTFPGPGKYPINRAIQERSSVSILDSILNFITGDSAVASGAARGRAASSNLATLSRERVNSRARTAAMRSAEPSPPPPSVSAEIAAAPPPPVVAETRRPEFAHDVPMPEAMPGIVGGSATRAYAYTAATPVLRSRRFNEINIAKSENICLTPLSGLQLWRASADRPEPIKIVRQSDNETIELTFVTGEQSKPWPEQFNVAPFGDYAIVNAADEEASLISIVPTEIKTGNLGRLALAYSRNNCAGQMVALEESLNQDGVERTNAAIFGAGGR